MNGFYGLFRVPFLGFIILLGAAFLAGLGLGGDHGPCMDSVSTQHPIGH